MDVSHGIIRGSPKPLLAADIPEEFSASGLCVPSGFCGRPISAVRPQCGVRDYTGWTWSRGRSVLGLNPSFIFQLCFSLKT